MRRFPLPFALPAALVAGLVLAACGGDAPKSDAPPKAGAAPTAGDAPKAGAAPAAAAKAPDTKAGLEALIGTWKAAHKAGDTATLAKLAADMIPTTADLKSVLKEGPATDDFLGKFAAKDLKADDPMIKSLADGLFKPTSPEQTEVSVTTATTEELVAYAKDGAALEGVPTGMQGFAALAKPKPHVVRGRAARAGQGPGHEVQLLRQRGRPLRVSREALAGDPPRRQVAAVPGRRGHVAGAALRPRGDVAGAALRPRPSAGGTGRARAAAVPSSIGSTRRASRRPPPRGRRAPSPPQGDRA